MSSLNIRLCSKLTSAGRTKSFPLKKAPTATSTPLANFWSWKLRIFVPQPFL